MYRSATTHSENRITKTSFFPFLVPPKQVRDLGCIVSAVPGQQMHFGVYRVMNTFQTFRA